MKSNYSLIKTPHYLQMKITGEFDYQEFLSFPEIIMVSCNEEKMTRILIDTLDVDYSKLVPIDKFYLGEEFAKKTGGKIKIACTVPKKYINKFFENVAVNRGGNVFVVDTVTEAEKWLTS